MKKNEPKAEPTAAKPTLGPAEVAFMVKKVGSMYMPMRLEVQDGLVTDERQIAPAGPYRPLAYQYLAGAVMDFYNSLNLKEAHENAKKAAGK